MKTASDIYLRLNKLAHDAKLEMSVDDVHVIVYESREFNVIPYLDSKDDKHIKYCLIVPEFLCTDIIPENLLDVNLLINLIHISWAQNKKFMSVPGYTYYDGKMYQLPDIAGLGLSGVWMYDIQQIVQRSGVPPLTRDDIELSMQLCIQASNKKMEYNIPDFFEGKYAVQIEDLNRYIMANEFVIREFSSFKEASFEE